MVIKRLKYPDPLWNSVAEYAADCSWSAGKFLAKQMYTNNFTDWERVFVALHDDKIAGYCTLAKTDCIPDVPYTPYIGYMFVDEQFRGCRLSQKLIKCALLYAKELHYNQVYLISDHINLYEKYGFIKVDKRAALWDSNTTETIFMHTV